ASVSPLHPLPYCLGVSRLPLSLSSPVPPPPSSFFFACYADHRALHSFPTRRSSDLCWRSIRSEGFIRTSFRWEGGWVLHRLCLRSEEHTSELQSRFDLVCRLLLEKKKTKRNRHTSKDDAQERTRARSSKGGTTTRGY